LVVLPQSGDGSLVKWGGQMSSLPRPVDLEAGTMRGSAPDSAGQAGANCCLRQVVLVAGGADEDFFWRTAGAPVQTDDSGAARCKSTSQRKETWLQCSPRSADAAAGTVAEASLCLPQANWCTAFRRRDRVQHAGVRRGVLDACGRDGQRSGC
jgi:hypothetical protein